MIGTFGPFFKYDKREGKVKKINGKRKCLMGQCQKIRQKRGLRVQFDKSGDNSYPKQSVSSEQRDGARILE